MTASMHWTSEGPADAPAVVFLHSLGSDLSMWRAQARALSDAFRVVRIDARGHGGSPAPPGPCTVADLGADVLAVADASGLDRFHVVGSSLGGLTALWLAADHGERLLSLTAANTAAKVADAGFWQARADAVRQVGLAGIRDDVVARFFADGFADSHPDAFVEALEAFESADPDGYIACCGALGAADLRDRVGRITVPTLVVGGGLDVATPPAEAEWLHHHIVDSRLEIIPGAAHLSNLDRPDVFTTVLRHHLEEATRAQGG